MARTKARWHGKLLRNMFRDGGSVVLLGRLETDPDRITEFRINRSNIAPFVVAVARSAELDAGELHAVVEAVGKLLPTTSSNGKHADAEEF